MKQPHTEADIDHTEGEQNTGNHKAPDAAEAKGSDKFGGTRKGAENIEPGGEADTVQSGPDIEKVRPPEDGPGRDVTGASGPHAERAPERDERGRL